MSLLKTFVQISDLHFGIPDPLTGNGSTSAAVKALASTMRLFHGSLGHQARSLRELQKSLKALSDAGEQFEVLATGDFSRCGDTNELSLANGYLTGRVTLRRNTAPTGLQLSSRPQLVAGNHDHWGANNSPFSRQPTVFPQSPLHPPSGFPYVSYGATYLGRGLVFIGIDSDADVAPGSIRRTLAHGHFTSQIDALEQGLARNHSNQLRILLIHHARHARDNTLRMTSASKRRLDNFCANHGVSIVLSGHTHKPHASAVASTMEVCCPSTTQIDEPPPGWVNIIGGTPSVKFERNGFVIHRLHDDNGRMRWDSHIMIRDPASGSFAEAAKYVVKRI